MWKLVWILGATWAMLSVSCGSDGGDDGGAPGPGAAAPATTTEFQSSACKKEQAKTSLARRYLSVITDETGLAGLRCVAWKRVGADEIKLDLYNFDSSCGATWAGDAAMSADGALELAIDNPSCNIALCGKCLYDWSFDVHAAVPTAQAVPLGVTVTACKDQQKAVSYSATLGAEDEGIRCEFADYGALAWQGSVTHTCGTLGMPCTGSSLCGTGSMASTGTCDSGLVCDNSTGTYEPRCLAPCASVADCGRADAWICQTGLCRPNATPPILQ